MTNYLNYFNKLEKYVASKREAANGMPLGAYIKALLFDGAPYTLKRKNPKSSDDEALRCVLGKSRLSNNVNQLAKAVNMGKLLVTPEIEADLR